LNVIGNHHLRTYRTSLEVGKFHMAFDGHGHALIL
jgi:hypothetical protein